MKMALVRIGIDTGSGGIHGPLFQDGTFEYIPIPDGFGVDERTYSSVLGRHGRPLIEYFPRSRQRRMATQPIHLDPEFDTFTYGDPTSPKSGLRALEVGDMLVFYCGLEGWDFRCEPALYIMGYFEVMAAGRASEFSSEELSRYFGYNFHVRHPQIFDRQRKDLVLVKGSEESRLLTKARLISDWGEDRAGRPLKVLSEEMQQIFGDFRGKTSFQRSPTRWVAEENVPFATDFVRSLD